MSGIAFPDSEPGWRWSDLTLTKRQVRAFRRLLRNERRHARRMERVARRNGWQHTYAGAAACEALSVSRKRIDEYKVALRSARRPSRKIGSGWWPGCMVP